jgi:UDP-N-acetylmuramate dehydrogenase
MDQGCDVVDGRGARLSLWYWNRFSSISRDEAMHPLEEFGDLVKMQEPLAPYTALKVGGSAEFLVQPRSTPELAAVVQRGYQQKMPMRVLGGGCNILVPDQGVQGVVLRLNEAAFTQVTLEGQHVRAGAGALLSALISQAVRGGLTGLENLVGIPGTVGGAVHGNAGDRAGQIGQWVRQLEVLDAQGHQQIRERDELRFEEDGCNLDDPLFLTVEFELDNDDREAIYRRMLKAWIQRKASQPLSFQAAARIFRNPRGQTAAKLIDAAGLAKTRVGGAEVSERDSNFIVAHPGASARDIARLIELVRARVQERFQVELELEIEMW